MISKNSMSQEAGSACTTDPPRITSSIKRPTAGPDSLPSEVRRFTDGFVKFATISLFVMALGVTLYVGQYILAPIVAGILVGFTFGPVSSRLERWGVSPPLASCAIVLASIVAAGALLLSLAVPLEDWSGRVPEIVQAVEAQWQKLKGPITRIKQVEEQVAKAAEGEPAQPLQVRVEPPGIVTNLISSASDIVTRLLIFLATFYFFLATRTSLKRSSLRFLPTRRLQFEVARIIRDTESYLSRYVATITAINIAFGVCIGLAMYFLGLPQPYLWGAMAMILNYAPYVGPAVMAIALLGVGLLTFTDSVWAFAPALIYVLLNGLEGQFITPTIVGESLTLNPLVVFVSIAFWLWLWGPIGAFLAVPILIIGTMTLYHLVPNVANVAKTRRGSG